MNFAEMRADVLSRLRGDSAYFTADDINLALNEGYEDLSETTKWDERHVQIPYNQGHIYYDMRTVLYAGVDRGGMRVDEFSRLPTGPNDDSLGLTDIQRERFALFGFAPGHPQMHSFLQPTRCFNPQTNRWLIPSDVMDLDLNTYRMWESVLQNEPQRFFMRGLWWLGLFPRPTYDGDFTTGYVTLYYRAIPRAMASDAFSPDFPDEYHLAMVYYALYDLKVQEREIKTAMRYWAEYQKLAEDMRGWVAGRIGLSSYPGLR